MLRPSFGVFCTNVAETGKGCEREWGPFIRISKVLVQKRHFTQRICDVIDFGKKKTFLPTLVFYPFKSTILSTDLKLNTSTKIYSTILKPILAFLSTSFLQGFKSQNQITTLEIQEVRLTSLTSHGAQLSGYLKILEISASQGASWTLKKSSSGPKSEPEDARNLAAIF